MTTRIRRILIAGMSLAGFALAGCGGSSLVDITNKQLGVGALPMGSGDYIHVDLFADGCPQIDPSAVSGTVNGHAMVVDPGQAGGGIFDDPCGSCLTRFLRHRLRWPAPGPFPASFTRATRSASP